MTVQQPPHLIPLPQRPEWLALALEWNLQVWGERIPGYDRAGWVAFYQRAMTAHYDAYLPGEELIWLVELDGKCVGCIALVGEDDLVGIEFTPWMAAFVIDPTIRHQGIGRRVVELFESQCRHFGIERLYLWTDNYAKWYSSQGYQELLRTKAGEIEAIVMAKDLL